MTALCQLVNFSDNHFKFPYDNLFTEDVAFDNSIPLINKDNFTIITKS